MAEDRNWPARDRGGVGLRAGASLSPRPPDAYLQSNCKSVRYAFDHAVLKPNRPGCRVPTGILLAAYCAVIVIGSVLGGSLPSVMRMTHLRTQLMMSFVGGLMLGIALLHMLPHAVNLLESASRTCAAVLFGIIAMFVLLRAFHTHQHGPATCGIEQEPREHQDCVHDHHDDHNHGSASPSKGLGWIGMLFGLGLHTMMDGVALAASVIAETGHAAWMGLAGLGTFLAVALHEPLDAFSITSVMRKGGWSPHQATLVNLLFALTCPVGAMLFYFGATRLADNSQLLGLGLATSAGFFICISLGDLLPEVSFHDHDRLKLTTALLLGVALAVGIENLPGHTHQPTRSVQTQQIGGQGRIGVQGRATDGVGPHQQDDFGTRVSRTLPLEESPFDR